MDLSIFTRYELITNAIILILISGSLGVLSYYYTNTRKIVLITFLSVLFSVLITIAYLIGITQIFDIHPNHYQVYILWISLLVNASNLSFLTTYYREELKHKKFDPDHVTRAHFKVTLVLGSIVLLLGLAFMPFVAIQLAYIWLGIVTVSILSIVFNHMLARIFMQDR